MNRDDIIRMAREAADATGTLIPTEWNDPFLERFATLVAAAEREACARVCEELQTISDAEFYGHEFAAAIRAKSDET